MKSRPPLVVALLLVPLSVSAQSWPWQAHLRIGDMRSHDRSSSVSGYGAALGVNPGTAVELGASYSFRPTLAVELSFQRSSLDIDVNSPTAPAFRAGSARIGITALTLQYRWFVVGSIRPYLGLGAHRATVSGFTPTESLLAGNIGSVSFSNSASLTLQAGLDYDVTDRISVNADAKYNDVGTDATLMLLNGSPWQKVRVDVDPWVIAVGVGFRF